MNLLFLLADAIATPAPQAPVPGVQSTAVSAAADASSAAAQHSESYLIFTLVVVTLFLAGALLWFLMGLARNPNWSIADAVSEEAGNQPATLPAGEKPIMVASSSRLIACLGLLVLIGMSIGIGYSIIWQIFTHQPLQLQGLLSYFYGMGALFAPYAVNQLKEAFSSFAQTPTTASSQTPATSQAASPQKTDSAQSPGSSQASSSSSTVQALPAPRLPLLPSVVLPALKQPTQPGGQN